jgi:hypothetical protein
MTAFVDGYNIATPPGTRGRSMSDTPTQQPPGHDTPTGTDPDAKYEQPGYEDKSLGQAVNQDQELTERLVEETDGDLEEAEQRFEEESAGAPARRRQAEDDGAAAGQEDPDAPGSSLVGDREGDDVEPNEPA